MTYILFYEYVTKYTCRKLIATTQLIGRCLGGSMNQEKMGKLIASLRKQKNLTQSELGALVGVGDRAVSKWERGITCPDISIINDLSRILGITSDELLAGELNNKDLMKEINTNTQVTNIFNIKFIIMSIILIAVFIAAILYINYNKDDAYQIGTNSDEYKVDGRVVFSGNKMSIIINSITYKDDEFRKKKIVNYQYDVRSDANLLYRKGDLDEHYLLLGPITIEKFGETININNDVAINKSKRDVLKDGISLIITFLDEKENVIVNNIEMSLYK